MDMTKLIVLKLLPSLSRHTVCLPVVYDMLQPLLKGHAGDG